MEDKISRSKSQLQKITSSIKNEVKEIKKKAPEPENINQDDEIDLVHSSDENSVNVPFEIA